MWEKCYHFEDSEVIKQIHEEIKKVFKDPMNKHPPCKTIVHLKLPPWSRKKKKYLFLYVSLPSVPVIWFLVSVTHCGEILQIIPGQVCS